MTRIAPGPVALIGGHEHRTGTEAIEQALLDQLGVTAPRVTVLPVATPARQVGMVAALARTHWSRLGAAVRIAMPDDDSHAAFDAVAEADVIVLPGGVPNRLVAALGASPVWDLALRRWRAGAALSASSAGAMSLFAWRLRLYPPNPFALTPGLGPFGGWVAAPHFCRFRAERWATLVTRRLGGLGVLGLDEGTAIVGRNGRFTVIGSGALTVVAQGQTAAHRAGTHVALDMQHDSSAIGVDTFRRLVAAVQRAVEGRRFRGEPEVIATQLWAAIHGVASLCLLGALPIPSAADALAELSATLFVGFSDDSARARRSVATAMDNLQADIQRALVGFTMSG